MHGGEPIARATYLGTAPSVPDPVLGDKMIEYRWSDCRDAVKYPVRLHAHMGGDHPLIPCGHNYLDLRTAASRHGNVEVAKPFLKLQRRQAASA